MFSRFKSFFSRYERRLSVLAFLLGFLIDNLTLGRIDRLFDNLVLAGYLILSLFCIALLNARAGSPLNLRAQASVYSLIQFLLPFSFGGLFSGFLVFYSRSGSIVASAPFLFTLFAFFIGSEIFKRHYEKFVFQLSVFFVALFSYSVLIVPVVLRKMGDFIFLLSGFLSLFLFLLVLKMLRHIATDEVSENRKIIWPIVVMIFFSFNFLYFNNMIPPIPLSLKEIGVYHRIEREKSGAFRLFFEKPKWFAFGSDTDSVFHYVAGEKIFVLSSIYAPADLLTDIVHRWEFYDEKSDKWKTSTIVRFPISGGRLGGFRGYSFKENIAPGKWRVSVETGRGQVIGRIRFEVIYAKGNLSLEEEVR